MTASRAPQTGGFPETTARSVAGTTGRPLAERWRPATTRWFVPTAGEPRAAPIDDEKISSYSVGMPRRKHGTLLPLETEILEVALSMMRSGRSTFHGFGLAQAMREQGGSRSLTAHGTLYKALGRLEEFNLLSSRWEDAAAVDGRPRRRLYELTGQGIDVTERALAARSDARSTGLVPEPA